MTEFNIESLCVKTKMVKPIWLITYVAALILSASYALGSSQFYAWIIVALMLAITMGAIAYPLFKHKQNIRNATPHYIDYLSKHSSIEIAKLLEWPQLSHNSQKIICALLTSRGEYELR